MTLQQGAQNGDLHCQSCKQLQSAPRHRPLRLAAVASNNTSNRHVPIDCPIQQEHAGSPKSSSCDGTAWFCSPRTTAWINTWYRDMTGFSASQSVVSSGSSTRLRTKEITLHTVPDSLNGTEMDLPQSRVVRAWHPPKCHFENSKKRSPSSNAPWSAPSRLKWGPTLGVNSQSTLAPLLVGHPKEAPQWRAWTSSWRFDGGAVSGYDPMQCELVNKKARESTGMNPLLELKSIV